MVTVLLGAGCSSSTSSAKADSPSGWKQVWADNFNGPANSSVNTNNWTYVDGHGNGFFGTGEVETTTSDLIVRPAGSNSGLTTSTAPRTAASTRITGPTLTATEMGFSGLVRSRRRPHRR